jgi:hypothetical protein
VPEQMTGSSVKARSQEPGNPQAPTDAAEDTATSPDVLANLACAGRHRRVGTLAHDDPALHRGGEIVSVRTARAPRIRSRSLRASRRLQSSPSLAVLDRALAIGRNGLKGNRLSLSG